MRAVVDVGSNSVLLTVARQVNDRWEPVYETSEVTALGEQVKQTGVLAESAITRTLAAVQRAFHGAASQGATEVLAFATMAARIASNSVEFQTRAKDQDTPIQVLPAEQEANLGFLSVANDPLFATVERMTIIDPGGHSTEIVTACRISGQPWHTQYQKSFAVGTLALIGGVLANPSPSSIDLIRATSEIDGQIDFSYNAGQAGIAIVLGATGTNLVSLRERMATWDPSLVHGAVLDYEEISRAVGWLASLSVSERSDLIGMEPGRELTIHAGALILERFLYALRCEDCRVSVRGWRHAVIEEERFWTGSERVG